MKNKLCYILLSLVVSFSFISNVFADEFVISTVVDNTTVVKGNEASIKINLKSSEAIKDCMFKFENDSNIEYVSIAGANGWVPSDNGVNGISITNGSWDTAAPSEGQNIAELKYKVNGDGNVVIKTVQCVSTVNETSYEYDDITVSFTMKDPADDTTLSSLTVTGGILSPTFSSTSTDTTYTIKLSSPNFGLSMTTSNPDYRDKIVVTDVDGNVISDPSNITFSDPSGQKLMPLTITINEKTQYSLVAEYSQDELDNSLESITINGEELTLSSDKLNYEYTVGKDVTQVKIEAIIKDSENFKFSDEGNAPATFNINDVINVIIVVEPKSSELGAEKRTYTIEIVKEGSSSNNNNNNNNNTGGSTNNNNNNNNNGNVNNNPSTGGVSMFVMAFILMASLVGSVILYQKNLESYK